MQPNEMHSTMSRSADSLANVMAEFDAAAKHLHLDPDSIASIREPRCAMRLALPVRTDDGHIRVLRAYHTIHSRMRGPSIGGVQFRPDVDPHTVEALAFWSSHRCALVGIPFGGSSGAIDCDPRQFSLGELERITRRYIAELAHVIGPNRNILTADIGTNQQIMCWAMDTYSMNHNDYTPAVVTGKPADLGGSALTVAPAAIGAEICIRKACAHIGLALEGARVAIQGFGKVGMTIAKLLAARGAKIIAIADISGAYINEDGIEIDEIIWHQQSYGILDGLEGEADVERLPDPKDIFALPVDILVPAAVELQITELNAAAVQARIIAEIAHDPVSPEADRMLTERGVFIIPDVLCNAGGVIGSYLEWVQNRMGYVWDAERVEQALAQLLEQAFDTAVKTAQREQIPLRLAAAVLAVKRIVQASTMRGAYA